MTGRSAHVHYISHHSGIVEQVFYKILCQQKFGAFTQFHHPMANVTTDAERLISDNTRITVDGTQHLTHLKST